jgi:ATP diphosphatase
MSKRITSVTFSKDFSPQAKIVWENLPEKTKQIILNNVHCGQCRACVTMVGVSGFIEGSSLVLRGHCAFCEGKVARVVEELI